MLLFGFLLLSTVLAAAQDRNEGIRIKVFIENGQMKSLELQEANEALSLGWRALRSDRYSYDKDGHILLDLWKKNIMGFEQGWYRLHIDSSAVTLLLAGNKIECLRNGMIDIKNLIMLDLSGNSMREIESGALSELQLLKGLNLVNNQLTDTEFAATLPPNLETLYLGNNAITEISAYSFSTLGKLQILDLYGNKITTIQPQAFQGLENILVVDLSNNPIERVEIDSFVSNPLLTEIEINGRIIESSADVSNLLSPKRNQTFIISHG